MWLCPGSEYYMDCDEEDDSGEQETDNTDKSKPENLSAENEDIAAALNRYT